MSQDLSPAESFADRALGAWLGLAVGDALGTTLEFSRRDSEPHHTEMIDDGQAERRADFRQPERFFWRLE